MGSIPHTHEENFREEILARGHIRIAAMSGHCFSSEQDGSASGFAWVAREPKLMCGAKGRASSQRSID